MAWLLKKEGYDIQCVFANTGQENNQTLDFIHECDTRWNLGVTWIEAVFSLEKGVGVTYKEVNYKTATRITDPPEGTPFDMLMQKNGIVTIASPKCTDRLKANPINKWKKEKGFSDLPHAIGIRVDEMERCFDSKGNKKPFFYPLAFEYPTKRETIDRFWLNQPFTLNLLPYQGNCAWCFKKDFSKLRKIAIENPSAFNFPLYAEEKYGQTGPNGKKMPHSLPMFRNHNTTKDIFNPKAPLFDGIIPSEHYGCQESCEPF